jgi:hypothetical protein
LDDETFQVRFAKTWKVFALRRGAWYNAADAKPLNSTDYLSIVGLGASGLSDVARAHDRYVGESIADEHLH